jgi:hypothetical protein
MEFQISIFDEAGNCVSHYGKTALEALDRASEEMRGGFYARLALVCPLTEGTSGELYAFAEKLNAA